MDLIADITRQLFSPAALLTAAATFLLLSGMAQARRTRRRRLFS